MWSAILGVIGWIIERLFGKPPGPSSDVVEGEKLGIATAAVANDTQAVKTESAVAQAEASAPKTQAAVVDSLNKGTF